MWKKQNSRNKKSVSIYHNYTMINIETLNTVFDYFLRIFKCHNVQGSYNVCLELVYYYDLIFEKVYSKYFDIPSEYVCFTKRQSEINNLKLT